MTTFSVSAPTRVDLAGGTLDLYPLYLFLPQPVTVNLSIDLRSRATVSPLPGQRVRLVSEDLGQEIEADSPDHLALGQELDLLARAVRFYCPRGGLEVRTCNTAPRGSGLGASSSLLMALSRALCLFSGRDLPADEMIRLGAALEAQNLQIPTGLQDYYGALYGGLKALHWGVAGTRVERIEPSPGFAEVLRRSLVLSFTGTSHFSGTSNWAMLKRFIDREGDTVARMEGIARTAEGMRLALLAEDLREVGRALDEEWRHRRELAEGVSTPQIDAMVEAARQAGALASKICGAGGGGCMVTLAEPDRRGPVEEALRSCGAQVLQAAPDYRGLVEEEVGLPAGEFQGAR